MGALQLLSSLPDHVLEIAIQLLKLGFASLERARHIIECRAQHPHFIG